MIRLFSPTMDVDGCLRELRPVLESGWLGRGRVTERLEGELARLVGSHYFVLTSSCTMALQLAVRTLGLKPGARVATTPITFVSSNAVLLWEGLVPLWCDVEARTGNIASERLLASPEAISSAEAMMVVHLGGYPVDVSALTHLGIPIIEDCAHALGSHLPPSKNLRCWSFHAVKNLPMGEGGGVSTDDHKLAERLRRLRWMGITSDTHTRAHGMYKWEYDIPEMGLKANPYDLMAAIGIAQLKHVHTHNKRRRRIVEMYETWLPKESLPGYPEAIHKSSYHFFPTFYDDREAVMSRLTAANIEYGMHYKGNDTYAPFKKCPKAMTLDGVRWYEAHELTLPLHPRLSDEDVKTIAGVVLG